jgi:hypothetical protein
MINIPLPIRPQYQETAQYICDLHVAKYIVDTIQVLSTAAHLRGVPPVKGSFTPICQDDAVVKWTAQNWYNYRIMLEFSFFMEREYERRFGVRHSTHGTSLLIYRSIPDMSRIDNEFNRNRHTVGSYCVSKGTPYPLVLPEFYIDSYNHRLGSIGAEDPQVMDNPDIARELICDIYRTYYAFEVYTKSFASWKTTETPYYLVEYRDDVVWKKLNQVLGNSSRLTVPVEEAKQEELITKLDPRSFTPELVKLPDGDVNVAPKATNTIPPGVGILENADARPQVVFMRDPNGAIRRVNVEW